MGRQMLNRLVSHARCHKPKIIGGDFNAWVLEGGNLLKTLVELEIVLENV